MSRSHGAKVAVMLVTRNFPPLVGGMENVNYRLLIELSRKWPVSLCGPEGCAGFASNAAGVTESRVRPLLLFFVSVLFKSVASAFKSRPSLILAGSGLTLPMAWMAARLSGARLGVYLHGLDIIAPSRSYQLFWPRFFKACDLVLVNSMPTAVLATNRGARPSRVHVLHPGTDIPEPDPSARQRFRKAWGLGEQPILLSVGRLTRRKGLAEFVGLALPRILLSNPSAKLVVVGGEATDSLTAGSGSEKQRIMALAEQSGTGSALIFIGRLDDSSLSDAYQSADLHVFPVLDTTGDVEGFGMVALEAAAHGLRTVAFAVGGVPDAVEDPTTGTLVSSGDYEGFSDAVISQLDSIESSTDACRSFARGKSWDQFGSRVRQLVYGTVSSE